MSNKGADGRPVSTDSQSPPRDGPALPGGPGLPN